MRALCRVLRVSPSGFYAARRRPPSQRSREDLALRARIRRLHQLHRQALGTVRTWKLLQAEQIACGKHRVARLRQLEGIEARRMTKFRVMHAHQHTEAPAPDRVKRAFQVAAPNRVWVSDITSILTREGWAHLAIVLDLYARSVVGWAIDSHQQASLPTRALESALAHRNPPAGLVCHSDQGAVYSSREYQGLLARHQILPSMSRRGNCHDNAVAESFFSTLKNELTHHTTYPSRAAAMAAISSYIDLYYNPLRPHTTLRYRSPMQAEKMAGCA